MLQRPEPPQCVSQDHLQLGHQRLWSRSAVAAVADAAAAHAAGGTSSWSAWEPQLTSGTTEGNRLGHGFGWYSTVKGKSFLFNVCRHLFPSIQQWLCLSPDHILGDVGTVNQPHCLWCSHHCVWRTRALAPMPAVVGCCTGSRCSEYRGAQCCHQHVRERLEDLETWRVNGWNCNWEWKWSQPITSNCKQEWKMLCHKRVIFLFSAVCHPSPLVRQVDSGREPCAFWWTQRWPMSSDIIQKLGASERNHWQRLCQVDNALNGWVLMNHSICWGV